jgi:hypothetical protein
MARTPPKSQSAGGAKKGAVRAPTLPTLQASSCLVKLESEHINGTHAIELYRARQQTVLSMGRRNATRCIKPNLSFSLSSSYPGATAMEREESLV